MEYKVLGNTGIKVSELCFGALTIGPLQSNLSIEDGGSLILKSLERGINFIDTAEQYQTYEYIRYAFDRYNGLPVIAIKSLAKDYSGMKNSIEKSLQALNREYIDIFKLHAARASLDVFEERSEALECLIDYKKKGYIRAIGISTHNVKVVKKASEIKEIDVVFPLINKTGRGILDGTKEDMLRAIEKAHNNGKGTYAMKVLVGGYLIGDLIDAIAYVRGIRSIDSIAIGMVSEKELELNLKVFNNEVIEESMLPNMSTKKLLITEFFCKKCGACLKVCPNNALTLGEHSVEVNHTKCLLCGYCLPECSELAIRII
ncbi:MAG: hypothetical protein APF76_09260 [Desulfitibacter sp. BRH_c19]|nr:MAG: hypothetical protein APF76_09260 [Desulfitibacter sp. BRH_c19]